MTTQADYVISTLRHVQLFVKAKLRKRCHRRLIMLFWNVTGTHGWKDGFSVVAFHEVELAQNNKERDAPACRVLLGRVHTTLFRSRPVRAQLPVSTRGQLERSFRILETTSRHGTSGRDRSRSVAPCQIYRVDARVGATDLSANQPLLAHAFLIYFFPF